MVPAAKRVGAESLNFAMPEIADIVMGRKTVKTAAKSVRSQTLSKQNGIGGK